MNTRTSGILLHFTSLPSPFGIGDLGPEAYRFADFLNETGQSYWQILPLTPTDLACQNSPYFSSAAFAGNPLLISPELLVRDGLLAEADLEPEPDFPTERVDFARVIEWKKRLLAKAFERFQSSGPETEFESFCTSQAHWLDDFAMFVSLKNHFEGAHWSQWPADIRDRKPKALRLLGKEHRLSINLEKFQQFIFHTQLSALRRYCHERGVHFMGDIPIYVAYDSVDLWTHGDIFKLDEEKRPLAVAGVPPDYFSETGQFWGNPVYNWDALQARKYDWWVRRIEHTMSLYDLIRIDHFRGLVAYWEIPAGEKTAINGKWVPVPADDFFTTLLSRFQQLPIIAEDLGIITDDVKEAMNRFHIPGMKVLLFAFGDNDPMHPYLPHTYDPRCIVYTGTHDTNTARGWFETETGPEERKRIDRYVGREVQAEDVHWELIRLAMMSVADMAIVPMQDVLGLGSEARMNTPGTEEGNWGWRFPANQLTPDLAARLKDLTRTYGRATSL